MLLSPLLFWAAEDGAGSSITGDSATSIPFGTSAAGSVSVQGASSKAIAFAAFEAGAVLAQGASSSHITFGTSASGASLAQGVSSQQIPFGTSASGNTTDVVHGDSSTPIPFGSTINATVIMQGASSAPLSFAGSAAGAVLVQGESSTAMPFGTTVHGGEVVLGPSPVYLVARNRSANARSLTVRRHTGEQLRFSVTAYNSAVPAQRQSLLGTSDLSCTIYRLSDMAVIVDRDHTNCEYEEVDDATVGDISYSAPPGTITERGRYVAKFSATIGGVPIDLPEDSYIALIIT